MTSQITRRRLLTTAIAALAAPALLTRAHPALAQTGPVPLALPPLVEGTLSEGKRVFDLAVAAGETEFFPGIQTKTIGIDQSYLGPVLKMRTGDALKFNVANQLGEEMTLHWHGLNLPAAADGGPHQRVKPGALWQPEFELREAAGTYWFHGHQMHKTAAHVWAGMAGLIRVEDAVSDALALPSTYGEDDFTLVVQDRRFDADGQMPYAPTMHDLMAGMGGDVMLTNGTANAYLEVPATRVRLRILNGSNGSFYTLRFADGRNFWQIASDGGLLAAPVPLTEALLGPAERAEIIVDCDDAKPVLLLADVFAAEAQMMGGRGTARVVELRPTGTARPAGLMPEHLAVLAPLAATQAPSRTLALETGMGMGRMGGFTINGEAMDFKRINFTVPVDTTEVWALENPSPMFHPFHIHNTQFRILSRNGQPPSPREAGLKDTVVLAPNDRVLVQIRFDTYTDTERPYMYHCHILEHEDAGMMGQFTVV